MKIAALIPIYAQPKRAAEIARRLSAEGVEDSGIFLVVDGETNAEIDAALGEAREIEGLAILEGRPHLGKAEALNKAVGEIDAELLLFIDNDIEILSGSSLLSDCVRLLTACDIAEIPKVGRGKGVVAAMVTYEFLSNLVATEYLVGRAGRIPSINGAAFTIRKELFDRLGGFRPVVNEDMDLAARAFFLDARFGFDPAMKVYNAVPETMGTWLKQRRRWAINSSLWATVYMERILKKDPKLRPTLTFSGMLFPLPFLALLGGFLFPLIPADMLKAGEAATLSYCALGAGISFTPVALFYSRKARNYASRFSFHGFLAFSLFYLPIWGLASTLGMINVASGKLPDLDWKHDESKDIENLRLSPEKAAPRGKRRDGKRSKAYSRR